MDLQLAGRRALVTGSSGGIGAAVAEMLAAEGCDVLVHGRNADAAAEVARRAADHGVRVDVVLGDLGEPGGAERVAAAARDFGVHILVNNAGPFAEHDWDSVRPEDWRTAFEGNVFSAAGVTQALLPSLRAHGWGRVINIGTRAVRTPLPNMVEYSAAKAAVVNMTTSLAGHLAGTGITANCVSPGVIATPSMHRMFEERGETTADAATRYAPNPVGRLGRAEDIAGAVLYLASPLADYVNGIELRVDGGVTGTP
ncbi:SDR family NAD(P)-dependent oxidoreductase [Streptomyces purpurogeneiscleroticus]|uniref:SDR family NAD(P)-dependent oxidoreductase n=1 Tax=Streptomyces purpurogeneiscleroticus TaxID=68259 RepID=UPI001CBE949A|nr:SDR family oxidoreductase [Streptomyces purpurogeneiscleroticus]MBZ4018340.1 short-chain dehydrogenase [Streptomyces purpurogeneiscleroticus]